MKLIAIEGNIGAGKSTILPQIAAALNATPLLEPVDTDEEFKRLLGEFTAHPDNVDARNNFQRYLTNQRADMLVGLPENGTYIIERSLLSDLVFTHACMANYEHTPEAAAKHMDCYKHLIARLHDYPKVDYCVYLKTLPLTAYNRMRKRGRPEEDNVGLDYLVDLSNYHDAVLPQVCRKAGTKMITLQWDNPTSAEDMMKMLEAKGLRL